MAEHRALMERRAAEQAAAPQPERAQRRRPDRTGPRPGDPDRSHELRKRGGWSWMRVVRRLRRLRAGAASWLRAQQRRARPTTLSASATAARTRAPVTEARPARPRSDGQPIDERRTSPLELLWDLVFVFAVTQVTSLLAHHLTWGGLRPVDARPRAHLVGVVGVRVGGQRAGEHRAELPRLPAAGDGVHLHRRARAAAGVRSEGTLFAVTYAVVRLLHLVLYADASRKGNASWSAIAGFAVTVAIGLALLIVGLVPRRLTARVAALARRGRDRLRGAGVADPGAAARPAAGRRRPLRRALQPVRDHLPRRVDHRDRRRRPRRSRSPRHSSPRSRSAC